MRPGSSIPKQAARYMAVGAVSNGLAYGAYILITMAGAAPTISMSIVYIVTSVIAFAANRNWTFDKGGQLGRSALRSVACQVAGYGASLLLLLGLHQSLGLPHQLAQLLVVAVVAVGLFLLNRYYVFN